MTIHIDIIGQLMDTGMEKNGTNMTLLQEKNI